MPEDWEAQLLAMVAFVETHGHGNEQASAIIWVILNRVAGRADIDGGAIHPNSHFSAQSMIAAYVLSKGQTVLGDIMMQQYDLLELDSVGKNYQLRQGLDLQGAVAQAYARLNAAYDNAVELLLTEVVNPILKSYRRNGSDPTLGSVYYGHIDADQVNQLETDVLRPLAADNAQFRYRIIGSTRPINPRALIVNNMTPLP